MKKLLPILGLILAIAISPVYGLSINITTDSSDFKIEGVVIITEEVNPSEGINCVIQFEVDPIVLLLPDYGYLLYGENNFKYIYRVSTIPERTEIHLYIKGIKIDIVINRAFYLKNG